jgi:hypothetical protein
MVGGRPMLTGGSADEEEDDDMDHDVRPQPSNPVNDHAQGLTKALHDAYQAWAEDRFGGRGEVWITTEVLLKGLFGFMAPTLVSTLRLDERGAAAITERFGQALADTIRLDPPPARGATVPADEAEEAEEDWLEELLEEDEEENANGH